MNIEQAVKSDKVSYSSLYDFLNEKGMGFFDAVNHTDTIYDYINDMMRNGIVVSHILKALETQYSKTDDWNMWLGNSMNTPTAINTKEELIEALSLSDEQMKMSYTGEMRQVRKVKSQEVR